MKNYIACLIACTCLLIGSAAKAQPFAVVDSSRNMYGGGAGATFGKSAVQPGFFVGTFHGYSMEKIRPDMETYGALGISTENWYIMPMLGAGATISGDEPEAVGSVRAFLIVTQTAPVAFRTDSFVMWTPSQGSWFVQQKIGPSIKLNQSNHRLFPYLAAGITTPGTNRHADVSVSPGCKFIMNF